MTKRPSKIDNHFSPGPQDAGALHIVIFAALLAAIVTCGSAFLIALGAY